MINEYCYGHLPVLLSVGFAILIFIAVCLFVFCFNSGMLVSLERARKSVCVFESARARQCVWAGCVCVCVSVCARARVLFLYILANL